MTRPSREEVALILLVILVVVFLYWSRNVVVRDQTVTTPVSLAESAARPAWSGQDVNVVDQSIRP